MKTFPSNNSWNDIIVEVFEDNHIEVEIENNNTDLNVLLVEKELNQLEIAWLKERDQYKLTDGLGNTFYPDKDFSYRMIICILQNLVGLLLFLTVIKDVYLFRFWTIDEILIMHPELRSAIVCTIITFITILVSFVYSIRMMLKGKKRYDQAKDKYLNQRQDLSNLLD